jgi:isopenicillin N synthase-like dioxygenase
MDSDLPIIDLGPFLTSSTTSSSTTKNDNEIIITNEQRETAKKIRRACIDHGFFYIKNHNIDIELISSMIQQTKDFFNLSSEQKKLLSSKNNPLYRGYISTSDGLHTCNNEIKDEIGILDQKESFTIGAENDDDDDDDDDEKTGKTTSTIASTTRSPMHGPNQWPNQIDLPKFQSTMNEYWNEQKQLCCIIAKGIALSLNLSPNFFDTHLTDPVAQMVLLKYPPPPKCMKKTLCQTKHPGCGERKKT